MSIWTDMQKRSSGELYRREDEVKKEEENAWQESSYDTSKWRLDIVGDEIQRLKKEQVKLSKNLSDLRRELDKFQWNKNKNYVKCNYK